MPNEHWYTHKDIKNIKSKAIEKYVTTPVLRPHKSGLLELAIYEKGELVSSVILSPGQIGIFHKTTAEWLIDQIST